ncbi:MAG TPA: AMP-binding protein [Acidimicrobiales bacterium]|nr:AMP-binding protein [Acidimicrobiales bacterium]
MTTVAQLLVARAQDDHVGMRFEDASWTWRQIVAESAHRAGMLQALRRPGPFHVGVLLENVPEYLFLLGGAALAGATVVGINPTRRGAELARDVRHTDCQLIVTDTAQLPLLDGLDTGVEPARVLLADAPSYPPASGPKGDGARLPDGLPDPDTLYLLLFTSGSTGAPKAVRVSQGRMASQASVMAAGSGFGPDDVMYCAMPLFHGNALNTCVVPAIASGAVLVLRRRFSASGFLPDVRRYGVTYFNYVGRALAYVLATVPAPDDAENTLRFGFGTDGSPSDISAFKRRFACPIVEGYGSSEGAISMSRVPGTPRQAMGKPPPGTDVVIVDPATGSECASAQFDAEGKLCNASDAIGEIVSRDGVARFEGYYANEEADAERTRDGWFWSGDLGYRDEDGFFYFAGRSADWLRVDGENFAAAPLERILARFPGVVTAVVLPVPDPRTGDQALAALELADPDAFDPGAFGEFLGAQGDLGTKWAPRFVRVTDAIPLTGSGKVDKRPLRRQYWKTADPVWWRPFAGRGGGRAADYRRLTERDVEELEAQFSAHGRRGLLDM